METHRYRLLVAAVAVVAAATIIGVALSRGSSGQPAGASRQSFIGRADPICAAAATQAKALPPLQPNAASFNARQTQIRLIILRTIAELRTLPEPTGDRAAIDAMLTELAIPLGEEDAVGAAVVASGDWTLNGATVAAAGQASTLEQARALKMASDLGLRDCASLIY